jgi:RHS repeat-associated protein
MLDNVMLVHMNGRVFDPQLGRFLSADPYVDGADSTQGWNRYAYVHGRFMSATDPGGFDTNIVNVLVEAERIKRLQQPSIRQPTGTIGATPGLGSSGESELAEVIVDPITGLETAQVPGSRRTSGGGTAGSNARTVPPSALCRSAAVASGATSGALGAAAYALLSGQHAAAAPIIVTGFVGGGVAAYTGDGLNGFVSSLAVSVLFRSGFPEMIADATSASVPQGAFSVPVAAMVGAVQSVAAKAPVGLSATSRALIGAPAGGLGMAAALSIDETLREIANRTLGCSL